MEPKADRQSRKSQSENHEGNLESLIGLDANILVYALDPTFPEHEQAKAATLSLDGWAINATVVHETYHTLVFRRKISPADSRRKIVELLKDRRTVFINLTTATCLFALNLAASMNLGGRDALIVANFLSNKVPVIYTHDDELLKLKRITWKNSHITFQDPVTKTK